MDVGTYAVEKSAIAQKKFVTVNTKMIDAAAGLFDEIATEYGMKPRGTRATAHGTATALAQVMAAYEVDTGNLIPAFNYSEKDTDDRELMALFAARRAANFVHEKPGTNVTPVTVASLEYGLEAWDWFKDLDYKFPDGRNIYMRGQGLVIDLPLPTAPDEPEVDYEPEAEVDPWAMLKAEIEGTPQVETLKESQARTKEAVIAAAVAATPPVFDYTAAGGDQMPDDQLFNFPEARILLAIRVAASIPDAYLAEQIAKEVLYG